MIVFEVLGIAIAILVLLMPLLRGIFKEKKREDQPQLGETHYREEMFQEEDDYEDESVFSYFSRKDTPSVKKKEREELVLPTKKTIHLEEKKVLKKRSKFAEMIISKEIMSEPKCLHDDSL
ncbi:MAG: hypothetical protein P4L16_08490 [Chlamydiales bacterium]|nr:hypothetical protein [Chlamydiales bacterium]